MLRRRRLSDRLAIGFHMRIIASWLEMRTDFNGTGVGFDVNDVSDDDFFFQDSFIDGRIQPELFCAFDGFETDDDVRDGFSISAERVFGFCGCELCDFAFVDFFCFFYPETWGW